MQFPYELLIFGKYLLPKVKSEVVSTDVWKHAFVWKELLKNEDYNLFTFSGKNNLVLCINLVVSVLEYLHGY